MFFLSKGLDNVIQICYYECAEESSFMSRLLEESVQKKIGCFFTSDSLFFLSEKCHIPVIFDGLFLLYNDIKGVITDERVIVFFDAGSGI